MVQVAAIIAGIEKAFEIGSMLLEAGKTITPIATELYNTIGKKPEDVTEADLDRLAAATDAAHAEVQADFPDDEDEGDAGEGSGSGR